MEGSKQALAAELTCRIKGRHAKKRGVHLRLLEQRASGHYCAFVTRQRPGDAVGVFGAALFL
jgi:hypothetical protein